MITQKLKLELTGNAGRPCIYAKQGDRKSRFVQVTLTNDGTIYRPEGVAVIFRASKPDGTLIYNPAVLNDDGTVTLELTAQTLAVPGVVLADVSLCADNGAVLSSASFIIQVDTMPEGRQIESKNEWLALTSRLRSLELGTVGDGQVAAAIAEYLGDNPPERGETGAVYTPDVDTNGLLTWSNDRGLDNPTAVDIVRKVVDSMGAAPVFGAVGEDNTITVSNLLPDGTYVLQYEDGDGNVTAIGSVSVAGIGTQAVNLFDPARAVQNVRWSNAAYGYVEGDGYVVSDYIPVSIPADADAPAMLCWQGGEMTGDAGIIYYNADRVVLPAADLSATGYGATPETITVTTDENGNHRTPLGFKNGTLQDNWQGEAAWIRVCLQVNSVALVYQDISGIVMTMG